MADDAGSHDAHSVERHDREHEHLTMFCMRNLLGWLEIRLAQITFNYLKLT